MHKFFALNIFFVFTSVLILLLINSSFVFQGKLPLVLALYTITLFSFYGLYLFFSSFLKIQLSDFTLKLLSRLNIKSKKAHTVRPAIDLLTQLVLMIILTIFVIFLSFVISINLLRIVAKSYPTEFKMFLFGNNYKPEVKTDSVVPSLTRIEGKVDTIQGQFDGQIIDSFLSKNEKNYSFSTADMFFTLDFVRPVKSSYERSGYEILGFEYSLDLCLISSKEVCKTPGTSKPAVVIGKEEEILNFTVSSIESVFFEDELYVIRLVTNERSLELFLYKEYIATKSYSIYPLNLTPGVSYDLSITSDTSNALAFSIDSTHDGSVFETMNYKFFKDSSNKVIVSAY